MRLEAADVNRVATKTALVRGGVHWLNDISDGRPALDDAVWPVVLGSKLGSEARRVKW